MKTPRATLVAFGLTALAATGTMVLPAHSEGADPRGSTVHHLTREGYRGLEIGMTAKQARATGDLRFTSKGGTCRTFDLADHAHRKHRTDGYLSKAHGLVAVFARQGMTTARGIGIGSTRAEVEKAYPKATKNAQGFWVTPSSGTPKRYLELAVTDGKVSVLGVVADAQDCFD